MAMAKGTIGDTPALEKLEGMVERVTFHSEESGFCVLRISVRGVRDPVTVVGKAPQIVEGEMINANGQWISDRVHGRQFKAEELNAEPPESEAGIKKFLGSGMIRGIGPAYAERLVEHFGRDIFEVIEKNSSSLEKVEGIGRKRRQQIKDSWNETRSVRSIMAFLMSNGVSTARAFRIYKTYGDKAIKRVQDDPYCLARDIRGIGFKTADAVARKMGIEEDSDLRARAGVEHVLLEVTGEGHCAYPRPELIEKAERVLGIAPDIIERAVDHGITQQRLVQQRVIGFEEPLVYLVHLFDAERQLVRKLLRLNEGHHPMPLKDADKAVAWSEKQIGFELAPAQRDAVRAGISEKVVVITGGPGVGKTTLVQAILLVLKAKKLRVQLAAPTGRAAKRLSETTRQTAKTIHRLLAFDAEKGGFRYNEATTLPGDVFIIDEASMLDVQLAWQLVRAIPDRAAVIFVGDVNQLPSVGPGSVLSDLINSNCFAVCRLTHIFRQAARSHIVTNAHRINEGQQPLAGEKGSNADFFIVEAEAPEDAVDRLITMVKTRIPQKFGLNPIRDIQVLTPMRRGLLGTQNLNDRLQAALNPRGVEMERFGAVFRVGDKVMQLENNYDKDIYNGDVGRVASIDEGERELIVRFDGRAVSYDFQELDELTVAYAVTIHKSQGSEYPCVVIPVHTQHYVMLQRNLLYTGVTRGRKLVVLVGTKKAIQLAVKRSDAQKRITTLCQRLQAEL